MTGGQRNSWGTLHMERHLVQYIDAENKRVTTALSFSAIYTVQVTLKQSNQTACTYKFVSYRNRNASYMHSTVKIPRALALNWSQALIYAKSAVFEAWERLNLEMSGSDFLGFGCLLQNVCGKRPQRDMFIAQWAWGSLFGTQCLVCLEPTHDIKQQGELAHGWRVASLLGCYRHTYTRIHVSARTCIHAHARIKLVSHPHTVYDAPLHN